MKIIIFFVCWIAVLNVHADESLIRDRISKVYNFRPRDLTKEQFASKGRELDEFWNLVKREGNAGLDVIRTELKSDSGYKFFYFDGASLLVTFSKDKWDAELAAQAIEKCDFQDLDWRGYFNVVRQVGRQGGDVVRCALKILDEPKFKIFVPQHALTIDPDFALIYMIKDVPVSISTPALIDGYRKAGSPEQKRYVITALWYNLDPKGFEFIDSVDESLENDQELKNRIIELKSRNRVAGSGSRFTNLEKTLEKRNACLERVSDEAMSEYEELSKKALGALKIKPKR